MKYSDFTLEKTDLKVGEPISELRFRQPSRGGDQNNLQPISS